MGKLPKSAHNSALNGGKLASVLDKSKKVKEIVVDAATDLAAVNQALASDAIPQSLAAKTVTLSKRAEGNVVRAADELQEVNAELHVEVAARTELQAELAETEAKLVRSRGEVREARAGEKEAWYRSMHDSSTGLPNRDLLLERLHHGLIQAERRHWNLGVLSIDLDKFKLVNDTHGHGVGNELLRIVAQRLQASVRAEDTVSRFGGDEFVCVLLDVQSPEAAAAVARKIAEHIAEPCTIDGTVISIMASVGIAIFPADGRSSDDLLKRADAVMYLAKKRVAQ